MGSNQLLVWGIVAVVVAAGIAQFVALASGGSLLGSGGVRNLDLAGEDAIVSAMTGGQPWVVFCDEDSTRAGQTSYQKARTAFAEAATLLAGKVSAGQLDCSRKMSRSGKSVYSYAGITGRGRMPATVLVAANGVKPRAAIPSIVTNAKRLASFVAEHSALKTLDLGKKRGVTKCLAARTCVVIAHSGSKGRRPVKAVVTDMMAAHRTAQFATLDTSKTWLGGLPGSLVAALPRAAPAQAEAVSRRVKVAGGKSRNVTVSGWGTANAAEDARGQVVFVLRRDPRKPPASASSTGPSRGNVGSTTAASTGAKGPGAALVATWRSATDSSGGGHGRMLVSRGDINAAIRLADDATERARAKGRRLSSSSAKSLVAEVMVPHEGQEDVGVALKRRVVAVAAPPAPREPKQPAAAAAGAAAGDSRIAEAATRRAEREARRAASRARAEGAGLEDGAAEREPSVEEQRAAELAARQAMEAEAQQWIAQPADDDDEDGDEDGGFEMEGYEDGEFELEDEEEEGFVEL